MASSILFCLFLSVVFAKKDTELGPQGREPLYGRPDGFMPLQPYVGLGSYPLNNIGNVGGYFNPLFNSFQQLRDPSDFLRRSGIGLLPTQGRTGRHILPQLLDNTQLDPIQNSALNPNILQLLLQQEQKQQQQQQLLRQQLMQQQAQNAIQQQQAQNAIQQQQAQNAIQQQQVKSSIPQQTSHSIQQQPAAQNYIQGIGTPNFLSSGNDPLMELMILQYILGNDGIQDVMKSLRPPLNQNLQPKTTSAYIPNFNRLLREFPDGGSRQEDLLVPSINTSILGQSTNRILELDTPPRQRGSNFNYPLWGSSVDNSRNIPNLQYQAVTDLTSYRGGARARPSTKSSRREFQ